MFLRPCSAMLVFGDRIQAACPRELSEALRRAALAPARDGESWIGCHARIVDLFIGAASLAQGVLDAGFTEVREDRLDATATAVDASLRALAQALIHSWMTGAAAQPAALLRAIERLSALPMPQRVQLKAAEGFAHYAVYPESYAVAARTLRGSLPTVIGLRSIGLGLGAMVAAATQSPLSFSVRPTGHPFRRELSLGEGLRRALAERRRGAFAIVDEGPGLSGSSFAAVVEALEAIGVPPRYIHLFPSHRNPPGEAASPDVAARWRALRKHVVDFDELALETIEPRHRLASWVEDLTGPALAPLQDIGAGRWRSLRSGCAGVPASPQKEKRKFLLRSERGVFLLRFAGLGARGRETFARACRLGEAGFSPRPLGLRHGFLVEPWEEATRLDPQEDRAGLVAHLAAYLAFRARHLPAGPESGATLQQLDAMRRQNIRELFGTDRALPPLPPQDMVRRVQTDNRMHAWEWLRRRDGRIVKTDASDHCDAHDLIGCQDIAYDVAGARIEFELSQTEFSTLCERMRTAACALEPALLAFYESAYAAFQAASFTLDAQAPLTCEDGRMLCTQAHQYCAFL